MAAHITWGELHDVDDDEQEYWLCNPILEYHIATADVRYNILT